MSRELPRGDRPPIESRTSNAFDSISLRLHKEPLIVRVRCTGQLHRIMVTSNGRIVLLDHPDDGTDTVVETLADKECRCREIRRLMLDYRKYYRGKGPGNHKIPPKLRWVAQTMAEQHRGRYYKRLWLDEDQQRWHDNDFRRRWRAQWLARTTVRTATYASQRSKEVTCSPVLPSPRDGFCEISGSLCKSRRRAGAQALSLYINVDPVSLLAAHHYMGDTLIAHQGKRRLMVVRVLQRGTNAVQMRSDVKEGELLVLAGREEVDSWGSPVVKTRKAIIERRPRDGKWRIRTWLDG